MAVGVYIVGTLIAIIHHTPLNNTPFIVAHLLFALTVTREFRAIYLKRLCLFVCFIMFAQVTKLTNECNAICSLFYIYV